MCSMALFKLFKSLIIISWQNIGAPKPPLEEWQKLGAPYNKWQNLGAPSPCAQYDFKIKPPHTQ